ncbi:hypothetical protein U1Q18_023608 [Sarracenia purpurea var. burkii]
MVVPKQAAKHIERLDCGNPRDEIDTQIDQSLDPIGSEEAQEPRHVGAPVVAHHRHLLSAGHDGVEQRNEVVDNLEDGELGEVADGSTGGVAVAEEIGSHDSVSSCCHVQNLVAPQVPELWEAVDEEDHRTGVTASGEEGGA